MAAILGTFALIFGLSVALSIMATDHSRGRAAVVQVADRQRTLAERYVESVLLVSAHHQADPATLASLLRSSAGALLDGGIAPAVPGDDDETKLPAARGSVLRNQLGQEKRLADDLTTSGAALLARRPITSVPLTAKESLRGSDPIERLRVLAALTSNVSLNAARTIASNDDQNITNLITMQAGARSRGPSRIAIARLGSCCSHAATHLALPQPRELLDRPRRSARLRRLPLRESIAQQPRRSPRSRAVARWVRAARPRRRPSGSGVRYVDGPTA